jgi:hypothetical protein
MTTTHPLKHKTLGDAATHGLFAGLWAGAAMALVLGLGAALSGGGIAPLLAQLDIATRSSVVVGALAHVSVSVVYGGAFGIFIHLLPSLRRGPVWLWGGLYGLVLYGIALLAQTGGTLFAGLPAAAIVTAHAVYGLVLGWRVGRAE